MKKMVRVFAAGLILTMALTACGGEPGSQSAGGQTVGAQGNPGGGQNGDSLGGSGGGQAAGAQEDSELSPEEMIMAKKIEATTIFFKAFQDLDAEAAKPYLMESDYEEIVDVFNRIKANEEDVEIWNKTIGAMIYLPDSDMLIRKSWDYIQAKWYTDCWRENVEIPGDAADEFPKEYLDEIFERYYEDAPYCTVTKFADHVMYVSEDAEIQECIEREFRESLGIESFYRLSHVEDLRAAVMMKGVGTLGLGYEYIEEKTPGYEVLLSKDIDQWIVIMDEVISSAEKSPVLDIYTDYYKNEETKEILQKFLNEQCEVYRDLGRVVFFFPVDVDKDYFQTRGLTEEDRMLLKQMNLRLVAKESISDFPDDLDKHISIFYDLVSQAKDLGLVK